MIMASMFVAMPEEKSPGQPVSYAFGSYKEAALEDQNITGITGAPSGSYAVLLYSYDWTVSDIAFMKQNKGLSATTQFRMGLDSKLVMNAILSINELNMLKIKLEKPNISSGFGTEKISLPEDYIKKRIYIHFLNSEQEVIGDFSYSTEDPFKCAWEKDFDATTFINEDLLTIRFSVSLRNIDSSTQFNKAEVSDTLTIFCQDMLRIFNDRRSLADVKVLVGGQEFLAHKAILVCHSSYFAEIWKQKNVLESSDHEVIELDGDSDLFHCVLAYVYTGKVVFPNFKSDFDLYEFAKKYKFNNLVAIFQPQKTLIHSKVDFEFLTREWNVPHFLIAKSHSFLPVFSPVFECSFDPSIQWKLWLNRKDEKTVRVRLECLSSKIVSAMFKISLFKCDAFDHEDRDFSHVYQSHVDRIWPSYTDPSSLFDLGSSISNDNFLRICCAIQISKGAIRNEYKCNYSSGRGNLDLTLWSSNFGKLLEDTIFTNVCLQVGKDIFNAHKLILSARSSVFCKMFQTNMSESLNGIVKIEDIDSSMMDFLLKYIYTSDISDLKIELASDIFHAADKYDLLCLKTKCAEFMKKNITLTNACELYIFGDLYGDVEMKNLAKDYICRNSRCLVTPAGQAMMKAHPSVVNEICDKLSDAFSSINNSQYVHSPKSTVSTSGFGVADNSKHVPHFKKAENGFCFGAPKISVPKPSGFSFGTKTS